MEQIDFLGLSWTTAVLRLQRTGGSGSSRVESHRFFPISPSRVRFMQWCVGRPLPVAGRPIAGGALTLLCIAIPAIDAFSTASCCCWRISIRPTANGCKNGRRQARAPTSPRPERWRGSRSLASHGYFSLLFPSQSWIGF